MKFPVPNTPGFQGPVLQGASGNGGSVYSNVNVRTMVDGKEELPKAQWPEHGGGHRKWKYEMGSSGVLSKWMKEEGLQDPDKQLHLFLGSHCLSIGLQTDSFADDNVFNW